ncbi:hypothetical protein F8O06_05480 [Pseudoclavibacter sp. CFCC 14310]|uniref:hypothetical protein n=1 Tax=Pseudoclavibacter sp. CFCC 14310 TaxID=2615180 RepID=UPI00139B23A5|nr:hypothetical protein [Pseudoclavibacter sp. CFCC 14310]KAB1646216.1 hypothetical protein F8O06_05480 [Pseudoclavibacter sp. CFCC 14310]
MQLILPEASAEVVADPFPNDPVDDILVRMSQVLVSVGFVRLVGSLCRCEADLSVGLGFRRELTGVGGGLVTARVLGGVEGVHTSGCVLSAQP